MFYNLGAQTLSEKDALPESFSSSEVSVDALNEDGIKADEAKSEEMSPITLKTVENVKTNDSVNPVSDAVIKSNDTDSSTNSDVLEFDKPGILPNHGDFHKADDNDVKIDNDYISDDHDDHDDVSDDDDGIDDEDDDVDDEDDEETVYHYIVRSLYDHEPDDDELYSKDEL